MQHDVRKDRSTAVVRQHASQLYSTTWSRRVICQGVLCDGESSTTKLNSPLCSGEQTFYSGLIASRTSCTSCPWDRPMAQVTLQGIFQASFPDYERSHPLVQG
jgi:hypothetical protein